jgi:hypothetical protein
MPAGVAVVCDTDDCFAVYLAGETGDDEDTRSASEVSQLARDAAQGDGWVVSFGFRQPVGQMPLRLARLPPEIRHRLRSGQRGIVHSDRQARHVPPNVHLL